MKLFFKTEEAAQHLDIPVSRLEFYIRTFNLKINQVNRTRKFSHKDLEKIEYIIDLVDVQGFTIEGAKEQMKKKKMQEPLESRLERIKQVLLFLKGQINEK